MGKCPFKDNSVLYLPGDTQLFGNPPPVIGNVGFGPKVQKLASGTVPTRARTGA
jgi:hypothetical protein